MFGFLKKKAGLRVLLSELGNYASGDEALFVAATRRLIQDGHRVSWLSRLPFQHTIKNTGFPVREYLLSVDVNPIQGAGDRENLLRLYKSHAPDDWEVLDRLLSRHDVLALAPGGKFVDGYCIPRVLLASVAAQARGIPVIVLHQSFGPLQQPTDVSLLREVLENCTLVVARDDCSSAFLETLGIRLEHHVLSRDLIFAENYPMPLAEPEYDLGINVRLGFNGHTSMDVLERFLEAYRREFPNHTIRWYSTTHPLSNDVAAIGIKHGCNVQAELPVYPDYLTIPASCRLNITDSFHGALFSMLAGRPAIIAQPDFCSHKFQGSSVPGEPEWKPLRGLVEPGDVEVLLQSIRDIYGAPESHRHYQERILEYGRNMANDGWNTVHHALDRINRNRHV